MSTKYWYVLALLGVFVAGFFLGNMFPSFNTDVDDSIPVFLRETKTPYTFIRPLLACRFDEKKEFEEFRSLEGKITAFITDSKAHKSVTDVSVYFRDLDAGRWVGVDEDALFTPASLLKIPIMIAYFKIAETRPEVLQTKIRYQSSQDKNEGETIRPQKTLENGSIYTVEELITSMITESDNNAALVLVSALDKNTFREIGSDLGIDVSTDETRPVAMSAKTYGLFFRILYNSSYLARAFSERALQLLHEARFSDGLVAGVPADTVVTHKFGERKNIYNGVVKNVELHDCGIVYYPEKPYLLCIMSRGTNMQDLVSTIAGISRTVYEGINSHTY